MNLKSDQKQVAILFAEYIRDNYNPCEDNQYNRDGEVYSIENIMETFEEDFDEIIKEGSIRIVLQKNILSEFNIHAPQSVYNFIKSKKISFKQPINKKTNLYETFIVTFKSQLKYDEFFKEFPYAKKAIMP